MSTASPAPALLKLKSQIDAIYPNRKKGFDGIMGDAAHQARVSDHNLGNALDITYDPVNGPDPITLRTALLQDPRTVYVIYNHEIVSRDVSPFVVRPYTKAGADPHEHHLHLSIRAERREDTSDWNLSADGSGEGGNIPTQAPPAAPGAPEPPTVANANQFAQAIPAPYSAAVQRSIPVSDRTLGLVLVFTVLGLAALGAAITTALTPRVDTPLPTF